MKLFGKKELEEKPQNVPTPATLPTPLPTVKKPIEKPPEERKPSFAPLFVKLEKYESILNTMSYLKNNLTSLKKSLRLLDNLDNLRKENLNLIKLTIKKLEKKILDLDSQFPRPGGFPEELPEVKDVETLGTTITDLRSQIGQLKSELESIA